MKIMEFIEDFSIFLDVVFTFAAVIFKNMHMENLSNVSFGLSGAGLMVAFVAMVIKRICKKKS